MTAPAVITSAQGTTFTFNAAAFKVRKISVKKSTAEIDTTTLDLTDGSEAITELAPIAEGTLITVEGWDLIAPDRSGAHSLACTKFSLSGNAICTDYEVSGEVKGKISFTATFRMTAVASAGV
jgi:hypothetical protein